MSFFKIKSLELVQIKMGLVILFANIKVFEVFCDVANKATQILLIFTNIAFILAHFVNSN